MKKALLSTAMAAVATALAMPAYANDDSPLEQMFKEQAAGREALSNCIDPYKSGEENKHCFDEDRARAGATQERYAARMRQLQEKQQQQRRQQKEEEATARGFIWWQLDDDNGRTFAHLATNPPKCSNAFDTSENPHADNPRIAYLMLQASGVAPF
jgi:hypothetical protein